MVLRQRAVSEDASGRFSEYGLFGVKLSFVVGTLLERLETLLWNLTCMMVRTI